MDRSKLYIGEELTVSGWGGIIYKGISSPALRAAQVEGIYLYILLILTISLTKQSFKSSKNGTSST